MARVIRSCSNCHFTVILSRKAAKNLGLRPFAEFILSEVEGLRVTGVGVLK
jgi:hypothetical protein